MSLYTILITLLLTYSANQTLCKVKLNNETKHEILSAKDEKQVQNSDDKKMRSENNKIIESNLKSQQELGNLKEAPLIFINRELLTYEEFTNRKDTMLILGKGKITEISIAKDTTEKMIRDKFNKPGNTGILILSISSKNK